MQSVICNFTCKPVFNFVSDWQSVELVRNVNLLMWAGNGLMNDLLIRRSGFVKLFSTANILMLSIYFHELFLLFLIFNHNFCNNNVDDFFEDYIKCHNFSTNEFLTSNSFIYREFNSTALLSIPNRNVLSGSYRFYYISLSFLRIFVFHKQRFLLHCK